VGDQHVGQTSLWNTHELTCVIKINRKNDWCSMGADIISYNSDKTYTPSSHNSKLWMSDTVMVERYRQGVKVYIFTKAQ